jgi:hypothetical protein
VPLHPDEVDDFDHDADMLYLGAVADLIFTACRKTCQLPPVPGDGDLAALGAAIDKLLDEPVRYADGPGWRELMSIPGFTR